MASNFCIIHYESKAGEAPKWWDAAYMAMAPGGGYDISAIANKEKGFHK